MAAGDADYSPASVRVASGEAHPLQFVRVGDDNLFYPLLEKTGETEIRNGRINEGAGATVQGFEKLSQAKSFNPLVAGIARRRPPAPATTGQPVSARANAYKAHKGPP
jgi:hypothetical protein